MQHSAAQMAGLRPLYLHSSVVYGGTCLVVFLYVHVHYLVQAHCYDSQYLEFSFIAGIGVNSQCTCRHRKSGKDTHKLSSAVAQLRKNGNMRIQEMEVHGSSHTCTGTNMYMYLYM